MAETAIRFTAHPNHALSISLTLQCPAIGLNYERTEAVFGSGLLGRPNDRQGGSASMPRTHLNCISCKVLDLLTFLFYLMYLMPLACRRGMSFRNRRIPDRRFFTHSPGVGCPDADADVLVSQSGLIGEYFVPTRFRGQLRHDLHCRRRPRATGAAWRDACSSA